VAEQLVTSQENFSSMEIDGWKDGRTDEQTDRWIDAYIDS
jgi:hypothetical protein